MGRGDRGSAKAFDVERREARVPMELPVRISGHARVPGIETAFTENVSCRGARVLSSRRWRLNERLWIATVNGGFRSLARVAYCQTVPDSGYAVGLEFLEPEGHWVIGPPVTL